MEQYKEHLFKSIELLNKTVSNYEELFKVVKENKNKSYTAIARMINKSPSYVSNQIRAFNKFENLHNRTENINYFEKYEKAKDAQYFNAILLLILETFACPPLLLLSDKDLMKKFNMPLSTIDKYVYYGLCNKSKNYYFSILPEEIKEEIK